MGRNRLVRITFASGNRPCNSYFTERIQAAFWPLSTRLSSSAFSRLPVFFQPAFIFAFSLPWVCVQLVFSSLLACFQPVLSLSPACLQSTFSMPSACPQFKFSLSSVYFQHAFSLFSVYVQLVFSLLSACFQPESILTACFQLILITISGPAGGECPRGAGPHFWQLIRDLLDLDDNQSDEVAVKAALRLVWRLDHKGRLLPR